MGDDPPLPGCRVAGTRRNAGRRQGTPYNRGICRIKSISITDNNESRYYLVSEYTEYTLSDITSIHIVGTSLVFRTKPNPIAGAIPWNGIALGMGFQFMP